MATTSELGAKFKAKHPGAYDDLSDAEVGTKVKAKWPGAYDDFTDDAPVFGQGPPPGSEFGQHEAPSMWAGLKTHGAPNPVPALAAGTEALASTRVGQAVGTEYEDTVNRLVQGDAGYNAASPLIAAARALLNSRMQPSALFTESQAAAQRDVTGAPFSLKDNLIRQIQNMQEDKLQALSLG